MGGAVFPGAGACRVSRKQRRNQLFSLLVFRRRFFIFFAVGVHVFFRQLVFQRNFLIIHGSRIIFRIKRWRLLWRWWRRRWWWRLVAASRFNPNRPFILRKRSY